ncbi:MAG: type I restriction enzyme HsdR N-terminal domain-containing protein [Ferruginibacter sp.]
MIKIQFPEKQPSIRTDRGIESIFCIVRKRWVLITPEEWVRQNFLLYLAEVLHYPVSLIAVEKKIAIGDISKRFDIVVYTNLGKPCMLVECKEMNVQLTENVLQQILRYNINLQAKFLVVTNGSYCAAFKNDGGQLKPIEHLPGFIE